LLQWLTVVRRFGIVWWQDSTFDLAFSSLMLGAFAVAPLCKGGKVPGSDTESEGNGSSGDAAPVVMDVPMARAVMDQVWRVAKHGAIISHLGEQPYQAV
jgi:hypothetical protein